MNLVDPESKRLKLGIVIPALNEEQSIADVVKRTAQALHASDQIRIVVADNASDDCTAEEAEGAGAEVVHVPQRGYGACCAEGASHLAGWPDVLVFMDADGSSRPEEISALVEPIRNGLCDLVLGRRPDAAHMTLPQRFGTRLAVTLINWRWGTDYRDMGPFRALTLKGYQALRMKDRSWGWTVEMQIRAWQCGLRTLEVPVAWDRRVAGVSKISGTCVGVLRAGGKILWTIGRLSFR